MVQLEVISGKTAGATLATRRFPALLGRSPEAQFRIEEPGVWDRHVQIRLDLQQGFLMRAEADALVTLNGQPVHEGVLRNGDEIGIGAARVRFWLAAAQQRSLVPREMLFWTLLLAVCAGQVALIYWLLS